jgi:hypothetical protein
MHFIEPEGVDMVQYDSIKRDWDINIENNDDGYIMGITMGYKPS